VFAGELLDVVTTAAVLMDLRARRELVREHVGRPPAADLADKDLAAAFGRSALHPIDAVAPYGHLAQPH
jgi:hypothetical protein